MKVYLVSKIHCYTDEAMSKDFEVFTDKDSALKYFEEIKESIIEDLMELEDIEDRDELFNIYEESFLSNLFLAVVLFLFERGGTVAIFKFV